MSEICKVEEMECIGGKCANGMEVMDKMGEMKHMEEAGQMDAGDGHGPLVDMAHLLPPPCFLVLPIDYFHFHQFVRQSSPSIQPISSPPSSEVPQPSPESIPTPQSPTYNYQGLDAKTSRFKALKPRSCALKDFDAQGVQAPT